MTQSQSYVLLFRWCSVPAEIDRILWLCHYMIRHEIDSICKYIPYITSVHSYRKRGKAHTRSILCSLTEYFVADVKFNQEFILISDEVCLDHFSRACFPPPFSLCEN